MHDAAWVQRRLKEQLAPDTEWSQQVLHNEDGGVPSAAALRVWTSGPEAPLPCGRHDDPGLRSRSLVVSKSRDRMGPLGPDMQGVAGLSRLSVVFDSLACLRRGLAWMLQHLDVAWVENRFRDPLPMGHRELRIGVRQMAPVGASAALRRAHFSEVTLTHRDLHDMTLGPGREFMDAVAASLTCAGIPPWDLGRARRVFLAACGATAGRAAADHARELQLAAEALPLGLERSLGETAKGKLAELLAELKQQAAAAGVPQVQLLQCTKPPTSLLRMQARTSCCCAGLGRVEFFVCGERVGETLDPGLSDLSQEASVLEHRVKEREATITAKLNGQVLHESLWELGLLSNVVSVDVSPKVYVYIQLIDEDTELEFVFVCGHLADIPEDVRPFVGTAAWCGGSASLSSLEALELGSGDCLASLQTLTLAPELPQGKRYEAVEWEDTSMEGHHACQFQRCLITPVRVGNIFA